VTPEKDWELQFAAVHSMLIHVSDRFVDLPFGWSERELEDVVNVGLKLARVATERLRVLNEVAASSYGEEDINDSLM
jgi:hypothetical protein